MRALLAIACAACGGGSSGDAPAPVARAASIVAPRADASDLQVATVNGRPVWGSCVAAQAAHGAKSARAALDECIAFELMAQTAEQRGLAVDPEVLEATRAALVNRVIATGFEDRIKTPEDLGDVMTKWLAANAWRMHRPELRASAYARINVPAAAPAAVEARAKALAESIAAALATQTGMFDQDLRETAERLAKGSGLELEVRTVKQMPKASLDPQYADALYALPDVGRTTSAVRTHWGWDVILWTGGLPPKESTREELAADAFPELRRAAFQAWVNSVIKELGVHVEVDQALLARSEGSS